MRRKRMVAFMLCLAMLAGLLGACGKKEADPKKETGQTEDQKDSDAGEEGDTGKADGEDQEDSQGDKAAADDWSWPLETKEELSMWIAWSNEYVLEPNELISIQKIEENTNVHIKWVTVASQEASEKFGLMMASGDYPDIIRGLDGYYTGGLVQACDDGIIYDMTDYIPTHMPLYHSLRESNEKLSRDTVTDDGRMIGVYTIASNYGEIGGERVWDGLCVRQDWLDEQNMEQPVTIDDWYTMLKMFKDVYQCEAPLLIGAQNGYDVMHSFLSAYGVLGEFYNDNDTVKYGPLEQGYRQWVELFRQWYAEGLIDPNFTNNDAAFMGSGDYIGTGRAGASANIFGWTADSYKVYGYTDDEDFFLAGVTAPVLNVGDTPQAGFPTSELVKETVCISKNCTKPELACRWIDYFYTEECMLLDSLGIEGDSYVVENGEYRMSDAMFQKVEDGEFPNMASAVSTYTLGTSHFGLYNWGMMDTTTQGSMSRTTEAYDAWTKESFDLMLPPCMTMTPEETVQYNNKYTAIKTLVQENTIKFITGAQSMDAYDAFVEKLIEYGIEDCIQYQQAAYNRYMAR